MIDEELAGSIPRPSSTERGRVRPLRQSYVHTECGGVTSMSLGLAEVYARAPAHYEASFCAHCRLQFPTAAFTWRDDGSVMGS